MPAATIEQRNSNFARLQGMLTAHCEAGSEGEHAAQTMAAEMPLSHAASLDKLKVILNSGALLSQNGLGVRTGAAENALETTDDVFFYLGAFNYPDTECGFLFTASLENEFSMNGICTPFDSGALVTKNARVLPPQMYPDGISCVRAHELSVPKYRSLLQTVIAKYSAGKEAYLHDPSSFVCACGAERGHPFGLVGGDSRSATFEVRLPQHVPLRPPHLRAVFVRKGYEIQELSALFSLGVTVLRYEADNDDDFFHALREACISFIQELLIS